MWDVITSAHRRLAFRIGRKLHRVAEFFNVLGHAGPEYGVSCKTKAVFGTPMGMMDLGQHGRA